MEKFLRLKTFCAVVSSCDRRQVYHPRFSTSSCHLTLKMDFLLIAKIPEIQQKLLSKYQDDFSLILATLICFIDNFGQFRLFDFPIDF